MSTGKGKKRLRNQPALYSEIKEHHKVYLTPTSWNKIKELSKKKGLSISEYIEQWIRDTEG